MTGWKRNVAIAGIIAGVYVGLKYLLPVMVPFFIGWLMAVWMYPLVSKLEKKLHIKKSLLAGVFMGLFWAGAGFLLFQGGRLFLGQVRAWLGQYDLIQARLWGVVDECCHALENMIGIQASDSRKFIAENVERMGENFMDSIGPDTIFQATQWIRGGILLVSGAIIAFISGVLFVKDLDDIRRHLRSYRFYLPWKRVLRRLKETGVTYLKAQLIIMVVIALICTVGMWLLKSPYYLIFGIGLGVLDALPIIGTGLILYPTILILFLKGDTTFAVGCIAIELITSLVREFMEPRLIGDKLGVYPIVIMGAIYLGFFVFGIAGFFLGPLGLLIIFAIAKEWDLWD